MTKKEKSWILYDWANSAFVVTIVTAILPVYFKDVVAKGLSTSYSTAYWGYINTIIALIVAISSPFLGSFADYKNNKKRFMVIIVLMGAFSSCLLSIVGEGDTLLCLIIYMFAGISYFTANIFYDSFLVDVTEESRMDWVSTNGFAWGYIGSTIPFIISIVIILYPSLIGIESKIFATRLSFIITGLWWLIFSIPLFLNVKQIHYIDKPKNAIKHSFIRLRETFVSVKSNKNVFMFLLAYFFYIDGVSTIFKMAAVYGRDIGVNSNDLLIILLVTQFVAFPFAILFGKLAGIWSTKKMLLIGIFIYTCISIYGFFIKTVSGYWILALLVATCQGGMQALSRSMYCKMIPKEKSSSYFGIYNIIGKFSAIVGPLMIALISQFTKSSRYGIISLVVLFALGFVLLRKTQVEA
jgi:UMF1 family MFS transporter